MGKKKEVTVRRTGVEKPCYGWDKANRIEDKIIAKLDRRQVRTKTIRVWRKEVAC